MRTQAICATCVAMALAGCIPERTSAPPRDAPYFYTYQPEQVSGSPLARNWYVEFQSPVLDTLIERAVEANFDIRSAGARVLQAQARSRQAGAALLPSLDAAPDGTYYAGRSAQGRGHEFDWSAMLSASYELDFWGRNRAIARSAQFQEAASRAERDTVELTTLAAVADTYFHSIALRERVSIAESNRDAAQQLLDVVQSRFAAGVASPIELATQRAAYEMAVIVILELKQAEVESRSALTLLLGQLPEGFDLEGESLDAIREPILSAGVPSELLTRRPDLFQAEANLRSARADVAAARAAMLPSISLTASAGIANPALPATVLTIPGIGPLLTLGGSLTQPIFDHGKLEAQREEAAAKETELLTAYRSSIVSAFTDVENSLAAIGHLNEARDAQREELDESERAFAGAKLRYEAGSGDYLTLLEAQRTLYAARDQFVQYRLARLRALVSLSKALGGGWSMPEPAAGHTAMDTRR